MNGNLEFRVLLFYLGAMYLFPVIRWRKTRRSPAIVGDRGARQDRARLVASAIFIAPLVNYLIDGPWPWYPDLDLPNVLRWSAAIPATLAVLLLVWACRYSEGGHEQDNETFITAGPYRWLRHPQLLASSIFFLSLSVLANNGVVLISAILGVLLLRLVVAPAVEAELEVKYRKEYEQYRQRTGSFFIPLGPLPKARYTVPRRFGLSAVLALTTIFAVLFGVLNYMHAQPVVYLFVSTEISAICLVQIVFGSAPRSGSALTGAVLLPFWTAVSLAFQQNQISFAQLNQLPLVVVAIGCAIVALFGALLGYCIGGLAAGFFLAMDLLEPYWPSSQRDSLRELATKSDQKPN
ncbi:MAG TPA: isoprenylcysteine carboxylmethyltransferase family protein [Pirellulaceae bacterium]|jgi:protein-S-isoprenylcysteine O-methyltransferase Ste14|nr:isoprenylcysteine carboxylmethyltransferase family protein [Pirellulaceae bacterium]